MISVRTFPIGQDLADNNAKILEILAYFKDF